MDDLTAEEITDQFEDLAQSLIDRNKTDNITNNDSENLDSERTLKNSIKLDELNESGIRDVTNSCNRNQQSNKRFRTNDEEDLDRKFKEIISKIPKSSYTKIDHTYRRNILGNFSKDGMLESDESTRSYTAVPYPEKTNTSEIEESSHHTDATDYSVNVYCTLPRKQYTRSTVANPSSYSRYEMEAKTNQLYNESRRISPIRSSLLSSSICTTNEPINHRMHSTKCISVSPPRIPSLKPFSPLIQDVCNYHRGFCCSPISDKNRIPYSSLKSTNQNMNHVSRSNLSAMPVLPHPLIPNIESNEMEFNRRLQTLETLTAALIQAQNERDEMKNDINRLMQEFRKENSKSEENEADSLRTRRDKTREELSVLTEKLRQKKCELTKLEGSFRQGIDELTSMRTEKLTPTCSEHDFSKILQKLNIKLDSTRDTDNSTKDSTHSKAKNEQIDAVIAERNQLYEILRMNEESDQEKFELERKLSQTCGEFNSERQKSKQKINALQKELESISSKNRDLIGIQTKLEFQVQDFKSTLDKRTIEMKELEEKLFRHLNRHKELELEQNKEINQLKCQIDDLELKLSHSRSDCANYEEKEKSLLLKVDNLEISLQEKDQITKKMQVDLEQSFEEMTLIHNRKIKELVEIHEREILELKVSVSEQKSEILAKCDGDKNQIVSDLKEIYTDHVKELQTTLQQRETELKAKKEELKSLREEYNEKMNAIKTEYETNLHTTISQEVIKCEKNQASKWQVEFEELKREANEVIDTMKIELAEERKCSKESQNKYKRIKQQYEDAEDRWKKEEFEIEEEISKLHKKYSEEIEGLRDECQREIANQEEIHRSRIEELELQLVAIQKMDEETIHECRNILANSVFALEDSTNTEFENCMLANTQMVRDTLNKLKKLAQNVISDTTDPERVDCSELEMRDSIVSQENEPITIETLVAKDEDEELEDEENTLTPRPSPSYSCRNSQAYTKLSSSPYSVHLSTPRMIRQLKNYAQSKCDSSRNNFLRASVEPKTLEESIASSSNKQSESSVGTIIVDWVPMGCTVIEMIKSTETKLKELAINLIGSQYKQVNLRLEQQTHRILQHTHRLMINISAKISIATRNSLQEDLKQFKEDLVRENVAGFEKITKQLSDQTKSEIEVTDKLRMKSEELEILREKMEKWKNETIYKLGRKIQEELQKQYEKKLQRQKMPEKFSLNKINKKKCDYLPSEGESSKNRNLFCHDTQAINIIVECKERIKQLRAENRSLRNVLMEMKAENNSSKSSIENGVQFNEDEDENDDVKLLEEDCRALIDLMRDEQNLLKSTDQSLSSPKIDILKSDDLPGVDSSREVLSGSVYKRYCCESASSEGRDAYRKNRPCSCKH